MGISYEIPPVCIRTFINVCIYYQFKLESYPHPDFRYYLCHRPHTWKCWLVEWTMERCLTAWNGCGCILLSTRKGFRGHEIRYLKEKWKISRGKRWEKEKPEKLMALKKTYGNENVILVDDQTRNASLALYIVGWLEANSLMVKLWNVLKQSPPKKKTRKESKRSHERRKRKENVCGNCQIFITIIFVIYYICGEKTVTE